jgi:hypothetical protein
MEETAEIAEQRQELETHITEHIADLTAGGMEEEEAFSRSVNSLGDLDELVEIFSGRKISLPIHKFNLKVYGIGIVYGVIYISAVVLGFNRMGLGAVSVYVGPGGFLAYFIPFLNALVKFIKYPGAMEAVLTNTRSMVRNAWISWALISIGSWIMNIVMIRLSAVSVYWAWMPTAGVFTWPLLKTFESVLIRKGK